jgi:dTDP-4-dehydrorhamnose reductase
MKKRILITGGTGFFGGHLLLQSPAAWEVYATFRSRIYDIPNVTWIKMDLSNEKQMEAGMKKILPNAVIHAAALSNIDECERSRREAFAVNTESSVFMAELCRITGAKMVFVSSDMVFDGGKGLYGESDPVHPMNYYGETKCLAEEGVRQNCADSVCARAALIYGTPAFGGTSFSHQMMQRLQSRQEVSLFTDQFRSPILVQNLAHALLELAGLSFTGVLHLGGSERIDRYRFGLILAELKGYPKSLLKPIRMENILSTAPRPRDVSFDVSRAEHILKTKLLSCREGLGFQ